MGFYFPQESIFLLVLVYFFDCLLPGLRKNTVLIVLKFAFKVNQGGGAPIRRLIETDWILQNEK